MKQPHVNTFEHLRTLWKSTLHPNLVIGGELASNLLAAGLFTVVDNGDCRQALLTVPARRSGNGPMEQVYDVLREINCVARFEVAECAECGRGTEIRLSPKIGARREGN